MLWTWVPAAVEYHQAMDMGSCFAIPKECWFETFRQLVRQWQRNPFGFNRHHRYSEYKNKASL